MQELININFQLKLNQNQLMEEKDLVNYLNAFPGDNKEKFLYFLTQIAQKQAINPIDFNDIYTYFYTLVEQALKILEINLEESDKKLCALMPVVVVISKINQDYFQDSFFVSLIQELLIDNKEKYCDSENLLLFVSWYIAVIKSLTIGLKDFHGNVKYISILAKYANDYSEKIDNIDFKNKGALLG